MIERVTKICQRTKSALISLIAASLSERARLLPKTAATASLTLSDPTDESDVRTRFCHLMARSVPSVTLALQLLYCFSTRGNEARSSTHCWADRVHDLNFWREFVALTNCSDPNAITRGRRIGGRGVNRRSASGAKSMSAPRSALCRYHIDSRFARQREFVRRDGYGDPKGRSGEALAVCAMTDP